MNVSEIAQVLAADLAGAGVDPNEAQKAMAYLRSKRSGKAFFDYLQVVVSNGQVVIRSRQTLDYYRALQQACQRHLRPLQHDYQQMALALGWALRLLRYYRAVPEAAQEKLAQQPREAHAMRQEPRVRGGEPPAGKPSAPGAQPTPAPPRTAPRLPGVGEKFTGKITEMDASAALIAVPDFRAEQAIALLSADVADLKRYKVGNIARVEVVEQKTQRSGRVLLIVRPAPKVKESQA